MNAVTRNSRLVVMIVLLTILASGQVVYGQDYSPNPPADVPQWARDRQQYETTYVYVPNASTFRGVLPQWVRDRQQYETTYVYVPNTSTFRGISAEPSIPQWVRDRQQYEITYIYVPQASSGQLTDDR